MVLEELRDVAYAAKPEKRKIKQSKAKSVNAKDSDINIKTENSFEDGDNASFEEKHGENDKEVDGSINQTNAAVCYSQMWT